MSAPPVPPSFGSFPELDQQDNRPSSSKQRHKEDEGPQHPKKDKHRGRDRGKHRDRRDSDGKRKKDSHRHKGEKQKHDQRDDERDKREEDRHVRLGAHSDGGAPGLFVVDKVGDPMNVVYGGLHAGDVPKYRRVGFGNVMGLGKAFKIINRATGGKSLEVAIHGRRPLARYTDPQSFAILTATRTRHLVTAPSDKKSKGKLDIDAGSEAEYVRLPSRRGRSNEPLSTYRSIHTSKYDEANSNSSASSSASDDGHVSSSESDAEDSAPRTAHQHSLAALEATLQKDPTSLQTWIALLNQTLSTVPLSARSSLARARAEIKLSVLDRAIRTHRQNKASIELRIKWLHAGAEVWDAEKLEKEWEQAVKELGSQSDDDTKERKYVRNQMWEEWLRWRVSSSEKGSQKGAGVEGIVRDARRALESIQGEVGKVKTLWRVAVVLKEAGFSERAMAIFQAQAELTLDCPPNLISTPLSTRLDAMEEFWDAEHPRIGEPSARGWDTWEREGKPQPHLPSASTQQTSSNMNVDVITDPYTRWAADEAHSDAISNMPKYGNDVGDDPYATILFSDVRPVLLDIITPEAKHALRIAWLKFLGLQIPGFEAALSEGSTVSGRDDVWSSTHLARPSLLRRLFPTRNKGKEREWEAYAGTVIAREKTYRPGFGCVKEWGLGVLDPLEGIWDREGRMWEDSDVSDVDKEVVRRVFAQLRRKVIIFGVDQDEDWDIMAIAFEAATSVKSALKLSRNLLATARNCLPLWETHARLERMRDKLEEARRIYDTALSASPASASASARGNAALWWAWAEMEWLAADDSRALSTVLSAIGSDPNASGAMAILRAKRGLEDQIRSQQCPGGSKEREAWACLRALLEVLTGGAQAIEEGMDVLERYVYEWGLKGATRESAWTRMLLLGWKHATVLGRPIRRTAMRDRVIRVIKEIEGSGSGINTIVLGIFLEGEKGESVWGRVRALVGERGSAVSHKGLALSLSEKGVTRRIWEVWLANWEKGRWEGEKDRVRNSLSIGVEEERTRASTILWRVYMEFEIYCGELKRAKALLFRAVSECPLAKELYLLAFGPLRSVFTPRELEGWAETMAERGIRMHRDLDEYAGAREHEEQSRSRGGSESEGEAELEKEARDYRRLAPF